jgi:predicted nucleic acid-binding Zn ribbon protein
VPLYVYVCSTCGLAQEHLHGVDGAVPSCGDPESVMETGVGKACGSATLEKQVTSASFRFERSTGWDGWDRVGPGTIGRVVDKSQHMTDQAESRNPGSRKSLVDKRKAG